MKLFKPATPPLPATSPHRTDNLPEAGPDPVIAIAKFYERLDAGEKRIRIKTSLDGIRKTNLRSRR